MPEVPKADPYHFLEIVCIEVIVSLQLDFAAQKKGGMAVPAVWRLVYFSRTMPIGTKDPSNAHRRDELCPSTNIQKQAPIPKKGLCLHMSKKYKK
jgi:hypothetical protein